MSITALHVVPIFPFKSASNGADDASTPFTHKHAPLITSNYYFNSLTFDFDVGAVAASPNAIPIRV